ncbi:MAG: hypothetical protein ISS23_03855 [Nanoarchaeota archaeon]|nr:hypothetical protein [Nanoarchaeota archaeon]
MKKLTILLVMAMLAIFLAGTVFAATLSIQLKRTNPGIAGKKSATLIYDVVNMDTEHMMKGFIVCQSPDDARVTSSYGAGTGTGAQYVSPFITMDKGPYQSSMTLTLDADSTGDKNAGCIFKYIPYKEVIEGKETVKEPIDWTGPIDATGKDVHGFLMTITEYTAAVEDDPETDEIETTTAKAKIKVDDEVKDMEIGSTAKIKGLDVTLNSATDGSAEITVEGEKTITVSGESKKIYLKMNGEYITELRDMYYRELRLDKSVPFIADMTDPQCPDPTDPNGCRASEVVDVGGMKIPLWAIIVGALVVILLVAYLLGKTSRS